LQDEAGAKVIIDDVIYFDEPMFSDGMVAQAVDIVAAKGVPYFSSAGNQARASYESAFRGVNVPVNASGNLSARPNRLARFHDFDPGRECRCCSRWPSLQMSMQDSLLLGAVGSTLQVRDYVRLEKGGEDRRRGRSPREGRHDRPRPRDLGLQGTPAHSLSAGRGERASPAS
jgi:hypothetical protein